MNNKNAKTKKEDNTNERKFLFITSALAFTQALLYFWKGLNEDFTVWTWIIIGLNFAYIPYILIFKRKSFTYFYIIYCLALIFALAFTRTFLYNNFTALFIAFIIYLIKPRLKTLISIGYFIAVSIAFALNEETLYHYFIHMTRALWFYYISIFVIDQRYQRNKLQLYDDEIKILTQLCNNHLQKSIEFEGYSESTIYRRLKAAMNRNHLTKKELIEEFRKEYMESGKSAEN